jgi:hypothetical protein
MKKIFILWLFSGSLDCFCQDLKIWPPDTKFHQDTIVWPSAKPVTDIVQWSDPPKPDTVLADLLITRCRMCMAHNYEGFIVFDGWKVAAYLDKKRRPFKTSLRVWAVKMKEVEP